MLTIVIDGLEGLEGSDEDGEVNPREIDRGNFGGAMPAKQGQITSGWIVPPGWRLR